MILSWQNSHGYSNLQKDTFGGAGSRTQYLVHERVTDDDCSVKVDAKHALYQMSYTPLVVEEPGPCCCPGAERTLGCIRASFRVWVPGELPSHVLLDSLGSPGSEPQRSQQTRTVAVSVAYPVL